MKIMKTKLTIVILTLGILTSIKAQHLDVEGRIKIDTVHQSLNSEKVLMHDDNNIVTHLPISNFDTSQINELQLLSFNGDTIFISEGNFIILPGLSYLSTLLPDVQTRLNNGESPCQIVNSGVSIDSLYGKTYKGGLIFHLDTNTCETLIALSSSLNQEQWGCIGQNITGANSINIGDGLTNTISVVSNCNDSNFAAKTALDLNNGYSDWYLPTLNELREVHDNLHSLNYGSYQNSAHWSSSQNNSDAERAWTVYFENGNWNSVVTKDVQSYIIPIRKE